MARLMGGVGRQRVGRNSAAYSAGCIRGLIGGLRRVTANPPYIEYFFNDATARWWRPRSARRRSA